MDSCGRNTRCYGIGARRLRLERRHFTTRREETLRVRYQRAETSSEPKNTSSVFGGHSRGFDGFNVDRGTTPQSLMNDPMAVLHAQDRLDRETDLTILCIMLT